MFPSYLEVEKNWFLAILEREKSGSPDQKMQFTLLQLFGGDEKKKVES